jgi:hypothetical protein
LENTCALAGVSRATVYARQKPKLRISAIVDARFSVIVDGISG